MSGAQTLLACQALVVGHARPVTRPLDFALARGEVLGILGPNGSGKSTLVAALTGGARVFAGRIERAPGLRTQHQEQGFAGAAGVPVSARELLQLNGADTTGLPAGPASRLDWRADRLSGGQLQWLRTWACLTAPADLVILDEPTNNLDPEGVADLETALHQRRADRGVLLISHDPRFVAAVCDRSVQLGPEQ